MSMKKPLDDLWVKTHRTNHLGTRLERQATAGAWIPPALARSLEHYKRLTTIAQPLLANVLGSELAMLCQVVHAKDDRLTLCVPSTTAVGHVRYLRSSCLEVLHQHHEFGRFTKLSVITRTRHRTVQTSHTRQRKKPLSENTVQTITQSAQIVISNEKLKDAMIALAKSLKNNNEHDF